MKLGRLKMSKQTLIDALTKEYQEAEELLEECIENDESEAVRYAVLNLKKAYESAINLVNEHLADDNWISVDDDLPKNFETVLLYGTKYKGEPVIPMMANGHFVAGLAKTFGVNDGFSVRMFVTHWRPLPQPPKE